MKASGFNEMVSLTEKPCRFTLAGLFSFSGAPQYVKPFVKGNKNDFIDAEAICEAASRPAMRFCSIKTAEQQALSALHRVREPSACLGRR